MAVELESGSKTKAVDFDEKLLSHIRSSRNDEARSMITRDLANAFDDFGTLLHYAAMYGNASIVRHLIELSSEIDSRGRAGKTPLMLAVSGGRTAAMKVLLNVDADIDIADDDERSALQTAFSRDYVNADIAESFARKLQTKTRTNTEELAERIIAAGGNMCHAATLGDVELTKCMLNRGVDVNSVGSNGRSGLHSSAEMKHSDVANWLVKSGADVDALDKRGNSALLVSAGSGSTEVTRVLLERGADPNRTDRIDGFTPLLVAFKKSRGRVDEQYIECVELLLEYGAVMMNDKSLKYLEAKRLQPIATSFDAKLLSDIERGIGRAVRMLNPNLARAFDEFGTLLHHAALHGNASVARRLIELGSKVDLSVKGRTPLMLAVQSRNAATIEVLLEADADIDAADRDGASALRMAFDEKASTDPRFIGTDVPRMFFRKLQTKVRAIEELAEKFIDIGGNPYQAVMLGDVDLMKCMLKRGIDIDGKDSKGRTALHAAAHLNDLDLVDWLVKSGANVNAIDMWRKSPLLTATTLGNEVMMKVLLKNGADPNKLGFGHRVTPLFALFATTRQRPREQLVGCAELLIRFGAVPRNSSPDHTLLECAFERSCKEAIEVVICHLAMLDEDIARSLMVRGYEKHRAKMLEVEKYYELCRRTLEIVIFGKLSLDDLLRMDECQMKVLARKKTFLYEVDKFCAERKLSELYRFYYKTLMTLIDAADRLIRLEDQTIPVICKLFNGNFNCCYIFARNIIGYLNVLDLEKLLQV